MSQARATLGQALLPGCHARIGAYLPIAVTNEWEFPWMAKKINGDFGNTVGEDLVPKRKGFIQWVEVLSGGRYILDVIDVKKRVPMAVGYVAAYLSGVSGVLCIATSALVSEFHGHWATSMWVEKGASPFGEALSSAP